MRDLYSVMVEGDPARVPYLHGVLLEEAERVGKHLQRLHFLPVDSF